MLDGRRLPCVDNETQNVQNILFEGYTRFREVENFVAFNFGRDLIHPAANYLVSLHESKVVYQSCLIHPLLYNDEITPSCLTISCHSAFTAEKALDDKIVKKRKKMNQVL